jgi:hypothetical protein
MYRPRVSGRVTKKPCACEHPMEASTCQVSAVSTPSATTSSERLCARSTTARTIALPPPPPEPMPWKRLVDLDLGYGEPPQAGQRRLAHAAMALRSTKVRQRSDEAVT